MDSLISNLLLELIFGSGRTENTQIIILKSIYFHNKMLTNLHQNKPHLKHKFCFCAV